MSQNKNPRRFWQLGLACLLFCDCSASSRAADWVRAGVNTNQPLWGIRGGMQWAIPPGGFPAPGGPRGLIRVGFPTSTNRECQLINFIAVEPIVDGRRGLSELEESQLDHVRGKRLWPIAETNGGLLSPGQLSQVSPGVEELSVDIGVEPFANGAQVHLTISQRSDQSDEIRLTVHKDPGGADMKYCVLTATMGNKARLRQLWLKDKVVSSLDLYPNYKADGFAPHQNYGLDHLRRNKDDDVIVPATNDEQDPASVWPFPGTGRWRYTGAKVTQYWKQPRNAVRRDLECVVNGRYTYWQSQQPVPGGVAFENFELLEQFYEGQEFIFGMTRQAPSPSSE